MKSPYEQCAFFLKEYELELRKRKNNYFTKKDKEKKKIDKNVIIYKTKIYENLEKINNNLKSDLEIKKLKQLNELFQVLLTEESEIYNKKNEDNKKNDDKKGEMKEKEIIFLNDK